MFYVYILSSLSSFRKTSFIINYFRLGTLRLACGLHEIHKIKNYLSVRPCLPAEALCEGCEWIEGHSLPHAHPF